MAGIFPDDLSRLFTKTIIERVLTVDGFQNFNKLQPEEYNISIP